MKRVLLIEDDNILSENTKELLELAGFKVEVASNGKTGVALAFDKKFDIILCDIMMPELDGYGVYKALSKNKKTRTTPFIFISAKSEHTDIRKGMILGADDYITKPFTEKELIHSINSRLARHKTLHKTADLKNPSLEESIPHLPDLESLRNYAANYGKYLKVYRRNEIYNEDKSSNYIYFVERGLVKTHTIDESGKELVLDIHKKGDFFGFCSLKHKKTYTETATSVETCELYSIKSSEFRDILKENHELTLELVEVLSDKVSILKKHLLQMAYATVLQKTTKTLLEFAEKLSDDPCELVTVSRTDLASVAGISTESFIRCLTQLKNEGLVEVNGRHITILNLQKLKEVY